MTAIPLSAEDYVVLNGSTLFLLGIITGAPQRTRLSEPNLLSAGTKRGKLEKLYSTNEFQLTLEDEFPKISYVHDGKVTVRQEALIELGSKQDFCEIWLF